VIKKGIFKSDSNESYETTLLDLSVQDMDTIELVKMVRAKSSTKLTRNELEFWLDRALRRFIHLTKKVKGDAGERIYFDALKSIFDKNPGLSKDCGIRTLDDPINLDSTLSRRIKSYRVHQKAYQKKQFAFSIPNRIKSSDEYKLLKILEEKERKS
jgi:hypothetical protein